MSTATYTLTEPGIYDMPEHVYHADPVPAGSLSQSGAKKLLPPSCPAIFDYERQHPRPPTQAMELGTAAHKLVLGVGQELAIIDAKTWQGKTAKDEAAAARAEGKLPLLTHEHETVKAMAEAIRQHPKAGPLFDPDRGGTFEQSFFWEADGIWKRARLDKMPDLDRPGRPVLADYKTTKSASPASIPKAVADYGYDMQADHYTEAVLCTTGVHPSFVFAFQEKTPPYVITVAELNADYMTRGRARMQRAIEIYRDCTESGVWPDHTIDPTGIELIAPPYWAREDYL